MFIIGVDTHRQMAFTLRLSRNKVHSHQVCAAVIPSLFGCHGNVEASCIGVL